MQSEEDNQRSVGKRPVTSKPRNFVNFVSAKQRDMDAKVSKHDALN